MSSVIVVDFEGFQLDEHDFVIKEFAFYEIDYGYNCQWTFLPPYPWEQLSFKKRKSFAWLTRFYHKLRWDSGELPFSSLEPILSSLLISYKIIFTKGLEKTKFLEQISGRKILNLNDFSCPKSYPLKDATVKCRMHKPNFKQCALQKALSYGLFIKERLDSAIVSRAQYVDHRASQAAEQDKKKKSAFLKKCPNSVIKGVCECALNLLKGNIPVTKRIKNRLIPHKRTLPRLGDKKVPLFKKRRLLVQKGEGFLSLLIPAAVSVLSSLINGVRT